MGRQDQFDLIVPDAFDRAAIDTVVEVAKNGVSYRNVKVGALALVESSEGWLFVLHGTNYSPVRGAPKRCAEMDILNQIDELASDGTKVVVRRLYVAGPGDEGLIEEVNGRPAKTLCPCADCRDLFRQSPAILESTEIVTCGIDDEGLITAIDRTTVAGLHEQFKEVPRPRSSLELVGSVATAQAVT